MEQAIKLIGAALTKNGKYKIFLESADGSNQPMGTREIDADAIRLLFPVPLNDKGDAKELESRLHQGLLNSKNAKAIKILHDLITIDKIVRIKRAHLANY
ncbi:hypothetical protein [Paludibacterium denitrificans]|uniref:Uncharacterized protein n=1 Tax=Paludibacterium denitrificans TaxID=2675226 RepID=A0A844GD99_9NEIS|nr:hypothetical protein [Paludibacterium denitrificans]MTD32734.1 hypothetical protein [Paludibacterium denitrificans]HJV07105.1 hypothetical protein [Chromobacteriaceae bacterium]